VHPKEWFFQWAFCATAATIVSGGVAERIRLPAYTLFSFIMTGVIYPMVVYWTWSGNGWLTEIGYSDFAGSGIVHLCGGIAALVGAAICGPRAGRWEKGDAEFYPHNVGLVVLGTFILWFGWYGFNCGSTLTFSDSGTAMLGGLVAMNTTLSAAAGGLAVLTLRFIEAMVRKQDEVYDLGGMCNGILAGLVAVCAGVGSFEPGMAMLVGILGGCAYEAGHWLVRLCKVDDPLDAFSVHGMGGIMGLLCRPIFGMESLNGADCITSTVHNDCIKTGDMIGAHILGAIAIIAWSGGLTALVFAPFKVMKMLTYDDEAQEKGSDVHCSPPKAYSTS
jgi:Amt family ammonium transporter